MLKKKGKQKNVRGKNVSKITGKNVRGKKRKLSNWEECKEEKT